MIIALDPTPVKGDRKTAIGEFVSSAVGLVAGDYFNATASGIDGLNAWRDKQASKGQIAWSLWCEVLALGLNDFLKTTTLDRRPDKAGAEKLLTGLIEQGARLCENGEISLDAANLRNPLSLPLYQKIRDQLPEITKSFALGHGQSDDALKAQLDRSFYHGFKKAWVANFEQFEELNAVIQSPIGELDEPEQAWAKYADWLRSQVDDEPLFGQDEGGLTLKDIFVQLRCHWHDLRHTSGDNEEVLIKTVEIGWLNRTLRDWALSTDKADLLRIVTGGPGSGKSSSAKVLARDISRAGLMNVYMIPLQGLDVSHPIDGIIQTFYERSSISSPFSENPLNWLRDEYKPLLLIFDGLDEVAPPESGLGDATRRFVVNLRDWLRAANQQARFGPKIKAIALGRPKAAEGAASEIGLQRGQLLHVMHLAKFGELGEEETDTDNLTEIDQRDEFWRKSRKIADCPEQPPEGFMGSDLADLTQEPLLFYLLIYSGYAGDHWAKAAENRNRIYFAIFEKVHRRDVDKGTELARSLGQTDQQRAANFFTLMECLGLAAWRNGGRTGDDADFNHLRDRIYAYHRQKIFNGIEAAQLNNVALQFFARPSESAPGEFSFIHKTFGEYLTARALIEAGRRWGTAPEDLDTDDFARRWLLLTGPQPLSETIVKFMIDEARLVADDSDQAKSHVETFAEILSHTLKDGFPAHQLNLEKGSWRERERQQRNAEEALCVLIHAWTEVAYPWNEFDPLGKKSGWQPGPIKIDWPAPYAAGLLFRRIVGQRTEWNRRTVASFARWHLAELPLVNTDLALVDLRAANLREANLSGAILSGANLREADLIRANLREANLSGAILSGANLREADLSRAVLREAVLRGAKLGHAKCRAANFMDSTLHFADLSDSIDLTQDQINAATGNKRTVLPPGLHHPEHWGEK